MLNVSLSRCIEKGNSFRKMKSLKTFEFKANKPKRTHTKINKTKSKSKSKLNKNRNTKKN